MLATWPAIIGAQSQATGKLQLPPAALSTEPFILDESVVRDEWPNTLPIINIPPRLNDLSPGQCFRVGAVSTGENAAAFLNNAQIEFKVAFGGNEAVRVLAPAKDIKQIKPEGADLVQAALNAGNVNFQVPVTAAMAASAANWCVPAQAVAGPVRIESLVVVGDKRSALKVATLSVISPERPGTSPIQDDRTMNDWSQTYYRNPQPEFLPSLVSAIFAHDQAANILQQFIIAAMKRDPIGVTRLGPQLVDTTPQTQAMMVKLAKEANVSMPIPFELSPMQKEFVEKLPEIPNAYDLDPNRELFGKLDQLWAIFTATGDVTPVKTIIGMLAWHKDYDAFQKLLAAKTPISEVTPEIARGLAYSAAGWSLRSFQRNDPLVADYIAAYLAGPQNPDSIKSELRSLDSNPAFNKR
jgi:hypothetical protein